MTEQYTDLLILATSLGGIGALGGIGWKIYAWLTSYIYKHYVVSLNINTKDPIYDWIVLWLKEYGPINDSNHWTVKTNNESKRYNFRPSIAESEVDKTKKSKFIWKPRPGTFYFRHYRTGQFMRLKIKKMRIRMMNSGPSMMTDTRQKIGNLSLWKHSEHQQRLSMILFLKHMPNT